MITSTPGVIITWPAVPGRAWETVIVDAVTGRDYSPVTLRATITVDPKDGTVADLLMITDEHGNPQDNDGPVLLTADGTGYRQHTFRFTVTGMHTQEPQ